MRHRLARILELFKRQPSKEATNDTQTPNQSNPPRLDSSRDDDASEEVPKREESEDL